MNRATWKWLLATMTVGLGTLQAWDSGAFSGGIGMTVPALVVAAVLLPAAAVLFTARRVLHVWSVLAAAVLLIAARLVSPVPLPELLLAAFFPAVMLLVWVPWSEVRDRQRPSVG